MSLAPSRLSPVTLAAAQAAGAPPKAASGDMLGRWREILSDPLNLAIERDVLAGVVDEGGFVRLHNGLRVASGEMADAYYGVFSLVLILNRGVHEPLEEFVFQELLQVLPESPTMLELGAYWGHYSMWLKLRRPAASVYLVEPDAERRSVGKRNFALNGLDGIFLDGFVRRGGFTVDAFLSAHGITFLDLLHADIQGYEIEMIDGLSKALAEGAVGHLLVSTHDDALHAEVADELRSYGYTIVVSSNFGSHTTAYDGFLMASRPDLAAALPRTLIDLAPLGRAEIARARPPALVAALGRALDLAALR